MGSNRIDVHHHFVTDFYANAVVASGGDPSGWEIPKWSPELDANFATKYEVGTSLLSLTAPGACILKDPTACAKLARDCNEYAAAMRDKEPEKYGILAALPNLHDKENVLKEIAYCDDKLKVDGFTLFSRYGPGNHYLGHPDFKDIWDELERRKAVVFIHPTHPVDTNLVNPGLPQPVIDYPFETTKAAVDLIASRTVKRCPNVKIILSHAGGTLPYLVGRPATVLPYLDKTWNPEDFIEDASNLYYDTAVAGSKNVLLVIEKFAKPGHVLYGSDYPYAGPGIITYHTDGLDKYPFETKNFLDDVNRNNALKLFPRLAARMK
ncbi:amidohydrolase 2 [Microthyrium microscopicum]|uniref:6-methylsalicylate decarboxylase n=1 Tax=Microthyrium microscopicum TaxID=703497 RepID=A0A6A6UJX8_9PEZI|nr:amidohydrolase 2 [Microthyrium microscopicum]